jgi:hypothetical protein
MTPARPDGDTGSSQGATEVPGGDSPKKVVTASRAPVPAGQVMLGELCRLKETFDWRGAQAKGIVGGRALFD